MKAEREADYRRVIIDEFGTSRKALRRLAKVVKAMIEEHDERVAEADAEFEMGRGPCPPGYDKRR